MYHMIYQCVPAQQLISDFIFGMKGEFLSSAASVLHIERNFLFFSQLPANMNEISHQTQAIACAGY